MTSVAAGSLLSLGFGYSGTQNNGNLLSQTIATPGFSATQNYGYDGANRLTSASEGTTWGQTYVYDNVGNRAVLSSSNIIFSDATPQTGSTASVPYSAANRWTLAGYDSAGNMTAGNTQSARLETMAYDGEERMTQWADTNPSVTVAFTYDGDGRRVTKTWNGVTTVYVYDPLGNLAAEYGGSAAPVGGTLYLTQDQLGSTRLVSDYNAATGQPQAVGCHDYLPFGEEIPWGRAGVPCYSQTADTAIKFTGQERDPETGLDYFQARYFSAAEGRSLMLDPDNAGAADSDPQSWNAYGYVSNNVLVNTDPSGMAGEGPGYCDIYYDDPHCSPFYNPCDWFGCLTPNTLQVVQQFWSNVTNPKNWQYPSCVAGKMGQYGAAGTAGGAAVGSIGLVTGVGEVLTVPGGALIGGAGGALAGGVAGLVSCASNNGPTEGGPQPSGGSRGSRLRELFGTEGPGAIKNNPEEAARQALDRLEATRKLPEGLSQADLDFYRGVLQRAAASSNPNVAVQSLRTQIVNLAEQILSGGH